jgi:hypothetical protein
VKVVVGWAWRYADSMSETAASALALVLAAAYTGRPGTNALTAPLSSVSKTMRK